MKNKDFVNYFKMRSAKFHSAVELSSVKRVLFKFHPTDCISFDEVEGSLATEMKMKNIFKENNGRKWVSFPIYTFGDNIDPQIKPNIFIYWGGNPG